MTNIINKNFITAFAIATIFALIAPVAFAASNPTVETLGATEITEDSATLNAYFTSRNAEYNLWEGMPALAFEYGETSSLGTITDAKEQTMGSRTVSFDIEGLDANDNFYYRAVLYTDDGIIKGDKVKFTTLAEGSNARLDVIDESDTVVSSPSSSSTRGSILGGSASTAIAASTPSVATTGGNSNLSLNIENGEDEIAQGDIVTYRIEYKNISGKELENGTLIIKIPEEMSVLSTSGARVAENGDELTVRLGDLKAGEEDTIKVTGRMRLRSSDEQVIARVDVIYGVGSAKNTETATDFDIDEYNGLVGSALGASAFGAGFFPTTIFGWLVVLGILLLILFITRRFFTRPIFDEPRFKEENNPGAVNSQYSH